MSLIGDTVYKVATCSYKSGFVALRVLAHLYTEDSRCMSFTNNVDGAKFSAMMHEEFVYHKGSIHSTYKTFGEKFNIRARHTIKIDLDLNFEIIVDYTIVKVMIIIALSGSLFITGIYTIVLRC